jgi:hypothetical protein
MREQSVSSWLQKEEKEKTMADRATLQVKDAQGTPDMELVLTDELEVLLRGAEILEKEIEVTERAAAVAVPGNNLFTKLMRYVLTHEIEETERAVERLAAGVPLPEVEEIGLDGSGFKIRLKGHGHPIVHLDSSAVAWIDACTFVQKVEEARNQPAV